MAPVSNGNIVSLDEQRARARLSRKESADTLASCRELALERMAAAVAGMLDRVEDDLFELAGKSRDRDAQNTYLDARTQARANRASMENTFRRHFADFFDRKLSGEPAQSAGDPTHDQLSLVNEEELEESIAVREMSKKLEAACKGELGALSQRFGFLMEKPELLDEANPMAPQAICGALKDACDQIGAGFKVRMALLHQFERHAEAELQRIYHDLNSHLVARSVLPDVRPGHRRGAMSQHAPRRDTPPATPERAPKAADPQAQKGDVFSMLAQLISPAGSAAATNASGAPAAAIAQSFVAELTRMHREIVPAGGGADASLVNVVRRIKSAPQSAALGTVDAMTIDIVAMLFDYIFEDRHIPSSVKALLGRLQIPTLKVALLDKTFFSSKGHPARRLLDLLAESALGLDDSARREAPTLALIASVVERVLADFETDVTLFETQAARVAAFIEEQKRGDNEIVERSARLIEEREREEIARAVASAEMERRLEAHARIPLPVAQMLRETWIAVLARTFRIEGEGSAAWGAGLATAEDLLWSVEPKSQPEDRKRLVTMLPKMLKNLQDGMARVEMPEEKRNAFLGALVDCHAIAVKAGLRGIVPLAEAKPKRGPMPAPSIERAVLPAGGIQVEEIRLRGPAPVANVFTRTGIWTNLQRGTWVEFRRHDGLASRARLTWISPNKGVYLFTNAPSSSAVSISPEALAEQMRLGDARIIDDAPLVARAVDSLLANLRQSKGAQG